MGLYMTMTGLWVAALNSIQIYTAVKVTFNTVSWRGLVKIQEVSSLNQAGRMWESDCGEHHRFHELP